ncbi:MAG: YlxR family protein [Lachnospiraceae bacterium]|nr:YlxR family protein [Lachnospiraceae bacterium]
MQNKRIPLRTCVSCRENKDKRELLRIVRTPEGEVITDETGRANGRGAYVCKNRECFEKLMKNHALDKAFKMQVPNSFFETAIEELFGE